MRRYETTGPKTKPHDILWGALIGVMSHTPEPLVATSNRDELQAACQLVAKMLDTPWARQQTFRSDPEKRAMEDLQRRLRYPDPNHLDALANVLRGGAGGGAAGSAGAGGAALEGAKALAVAPLEGLLPRILNYTGGSPGVYTMVEEKDLLRLIRDADGENRTVTLPPPRTIGTPTFCGARP